MREEVRGAVFLEVAGLRLRGGEWRRARSVRREVREGKGSPPGLKRGKNGGVTGREGEEGEGEGAGGDWG